MKISLKFIVAIAFLLICGSARAQTVPVTGSLQNLAGANATAPTTYVQFTLQNYGSSIPMTSGGAFVNPTPPPLQPNGSGVISGTITPNDVITTPAGTYYQVCVFFQGVSQWCQNYLILSSDNPWNLNSATPIVTPPSPSGNVLYAMTHVCQVGIAATSWTCVHGFGTQNVVVSCYDGNHQMLFPDTVIETDLNTITATFTSPETGSCVVMNAGNVNLTSSPANAVVTNPNGDQNIVGFNFLHNGNLIPDVGNSWTWTAAQAFAVPPTFAQSTGTAPFIVDSTTNVPNLNASSLNGATFAAPGPIGGGTPSTAAFTSISVTSSTVVANLNASLLNGATFAAPGPIGGGTPSTAVFTTLQIASGTPSTAISGNTATLANAASDVHSAAAGTRACTDGSGNLTTTGCPSGIIQSVNAVTMSGDQSYTTGSSATVTGLSQSVTMPASGGPFRALVCYGIYWTTGASATSVNVWVTDGSVTFASTEAGAGTSPVPYGGNSTCGMSTATGYANGASPTFTVKINANQNLTVRQSGTNSGGPSSWMTVSVLPSVN